MEGGCRTPSELRKTDDGDDTSCEKKPRTPRRHLIVVSGNPSLPLKKRLRLRLCLRLGNEATRTPPRRPLQIVVSDDHSLPLKKRIRLYNETTSDRSPHLPRAFINPRASSRDGVEPKLQKKKERKKAIKYSPEQEEQLKQKGMSLPLPEEVRVRLQELGGSATPVRLVIKHLFQTDLREHNGRLNLPETKFVKTDEGRGFLTEEEWRALKNKETMKVRLVGPMCTEPTSMVLKTWEMQAGSVPILTSGWAKFLKKYETEHKGVLREGDGVQLWATRCDGNDLLLALQVIHRAPAIVVDDDLE